ncbi:PAS domain S-box protein [Halorubrum sp. CBA1125]|uniref:ATP-binding protein n=1 Tax=Halorubrum sp. CBA1125 TaxID=2668072 RepID=UPI0012E7BC6F|nr:ATP-binding protein [Halorubrum sp. CBA1125]MUW14465.1 PAS domain S-box protein [Halorubrum sp. CBA1125]
MRIPPSSISASRLTSSPTSKPAPSRTYMQQTVGLVVGHPDDPRCDPHERGCVNCDHTNGSREAIRSMPSSKGDNPHILLVDPPGRLQEHLATELTAAGFGVSTATSAAECLAHVERNEVDGVVSLSDLPEMDGATLLRSIRISNPFLPVVLFSAADDSMEAAVPSAVSETVAVDAEPEAVIVKLERLIHGERESSRRYRHLIETSPASINIFDRDGNSIWCNDAAVDLLGQDSREEFLGRSILELIHPDDRDLARAEIRSVIDEKESAGPTRMKLRRDDGEIRYVRVSTAIGQFLGADIGQAVAIDETGRVERERQLQILDNWLRHNIRNKMTIIRGLAEEIQADRTDDVAAASRAIQKHANSLVEQADQERRIIRILELSPDRTHVSVDVGDLVARVVTDAREDYPEAAISIASKEAFHADAIAELDIAIAELVENAVVHSDAEPPEVTVEVEDVAADHGVIRIADNGPGIPEVEQRCLQLDEEIDQFHHGSGLGLVLVYWVIRHSNGDITVADNDPRGSVVTITLPKA